MPRRLDSVNQGGFVEAIDVDESELEAVVGMLGFSDAQKSETARDQIYRALEFFQTARSHSITGFLSRSFGLLVGRTRDCEHGSKDAPDAHDRCHSTRRGVTSPTGRTQ